MSKKSILFPFVALLFSFGLIVACGGRGGGGAPETAPTAQEQGAVEEPSTEPIDGGSETGDFGSALPFPFDKVSDQLPSPLNGDGRGCFYENRCASNQICMIGLNKKMDDVLKGGCAPKVYEIFRCSQADYYARLHYGTPEGKHYANCLGAIYCAIVDGMPTVICRAL